MVSPMKDDSVILSLLGNFALISLFAIGGANAAVPEMHRLAVDLHHWMTDKQFADLFAIAQLSPGPNVIIVTLIGYQAAGVAGAAAATAAMCGPTCVLAFYMGRTWEKFREARWRNVIQTGWCRFRSV
jgi:chromate transporter